MCAQYRWFTHAVNAVYTYELLTQCTLCETGSGLAKRLWCALNAIQGKRRAAVPAKADTVILSVLFDVRCAPGINATLMAAVKLFVADVLSYSQRYVNEKRPHVC